MLSLMQDSTLDILLLPHNNHLSYLKNLMNTISTLIHIHFLFCFVFNAGEEEYYSYSCLYKKHFMWNNLSTAPLRIVGHVL